MSETWAEWAVALELGNDERLEHWARSLVAAHGYAEAARRLAQDLAAQGRPATRDGAPYTFAALDKALRGFGWWSPADQRAAADAAGESPKAMIARLLAGEP